LCGIETSKRFLQVCVPLFELFGLSLQRGDLKCQLDALGVGATAATCGATAAIRGRRSSRGGSSPGLGSLACALVESQCDIENFYIFGTTHRARAGDSAFLDLGVFVDVPGLAAPPPPFRISLRTYRCMGKYKANDPGEVSVFWKK